MSERVDRQHIDSSAPVLKRHTGTCKPHEYEVCEDDDSVECDSYCSCGGKVKTEKKDSPGVVSTVAKTIEGTIQAIKDGVSNTGEVLVKTAVEIFSPLVLLINSIQGKEKKTVKDLDKVLEAIQKNKSLKKLSKESQAAFKELAKTARELSKDDKFKDMDISQLIEQWRQTRNHNVLLQMADKIKKGECAPFSDEKLKQTFIEGLESLGKALAEIRQHSKSPDSERAESEIKEGCHRVVDNVAKHNEKGGDANFTEEDKREVASNFKEARRHVETVLNDPSLSRFVSDSSFDLHDWLDTIDELFEYWDMDEEEREEKKKEEEQCEERREMKRQFYKLQSKAYYAKRKRIQFEDFLESLKRKIRLNLLEKKDKEKAEVDIYYAQNKRATFSQMEDKYCEEKCEVVESLPPSYVCGDYLNLDLDLIC